MSHRDNGDNGRAFVMSFFQALKAERVHHRAYAMRDQVRRDLFQHVEGFYDPRRPHLVLS